MPTSFAAAWTDLYNRLLAAAPISSTQPDRKVQVTFGPPAFFEDQEVIALTGIEDADEESAALGNQRREESYTLVVAVKATNPAINDPTVVAARVAALVDVVRSTVIANPTLGGNVRFAQPVGRRTDGMLPMEGGGWGVVIEQLVAVAQRIT